MAKQVKSVTFKGIQRNTSDNNCEDGALLEAINVRFKDGSWRGVGDKVVTGWHMDNLVQYDGLTYHPALPANTYVAHNVADNGIYTALFSNGTDPQVTTLVLTMGVGEVFDRFSHLGNVLLVFTSTTKHILYWDKTSLSYKDLTFLPVPIINVGDVAYETARSYTGSEMNGVATADYGLFPIRRNKNEYFRITAYADYLKYKAEIQETGNIEGFIMIRVAYKLFDGSYILHSQPYLHHIGYHPSSKPKFVAYNYDATSTYMPAFTDIRFEKPILYYNFFNTGEFTIPDFLDMGVVESLDVFSTRPVDTFDFSKRIDKWTEVSYVSPFTFTTYSPPFSTERIKDMIEDAQYYKVHSIMLKDIVVKEEHNDASGPYYAHKSGSAILDYKKDISSNQLLTEDNFTHHIFNALDDYQYNSRIHLANVGVSLSGGFNSLFHSLFVTSFGPAYNGYVQTWPVLDAAQEPKYLGDYVDAAGMGDATLKFYQQVWIKSNDGRKVITSEIQNSYVSWEDAHNIPGGFKVYAHSFTDTTTHYALVFNPIISYPDYRAYKIRYYYELSGVKHFIKDYDLKPNSATNTAYYVSDFVSDDGSTGMYYPIQVALPDDLTTSSPMPTDSPSDDSVIHDTNRMQVSGIFNPFIWPSVNSYRFGMAHNSLIAIRSVQAQMSDSQFGQYPLYVFSTDGAFTIMHGSGEVLYSSIQALNNEVLLSRDAITSISGAIVYATKEGVRILSGATGELISIPVNGSIINPIANDPLFYSSLTGLNLPNINVFRSDVPFLTYISGCIILYDIYNTEIIISNATYKYSYVFNLTTKVWSTRTEVFTGNLFVAGRSIGIKVNSEMDGDDLVYTTSLHYLDQEEPSRFDTVTYPAKIINLLDWSVYGEDQLFSIDIPSGMIEVGFTLNSSSTNLSIFQSIDRSLINLNYFDITYFDNKVYVVLKDSATVYNSPVDSATFSVTDGVYTMQYRTTGAACKYLIFQTRPLRLSSVLAKRIDKLVLRAMYTNPDGEYSVFQVYGSNDLANWNIITYQQCLEGGDVKTTRLLGNYKYFTLVFACARDGATVQQMDVLYTEKFGKLL